MTTETPPPRLVPDRPSASDLLRELAGSIRSVAKTERDTAAKWRFHPDTPGMLKMAELHDGWAEIIELAAEATDAAAPPAKVPAERGDKGPWKIAAGSRDVYSGDFVADVALRISGDFEDEMHRIRYAEWLCETLNRAAAPAAPAEGEVMEFQAGWSTALAEAVRLIDDAANAAHSLKAVREAVERLQHGPCHTAESAVDGSMREQAEAWEAVFDTLEEVNPEWRDWPVPTPARIKACAAIRALAIRAAAPEALVHAARRAQGVLALHDDRCPQLDAALSELAAEPTAPRVTGGRDYERGFSDGYERRDMEVKGALA